MQDLKVLYEGTKAKFSGLEKTLVDCYMSFLRDVANHYLQLGRRVFFRENTFVHWGEGNFGSLLIEGREETNKIFGEYISEIVFEPILSNKTVEGYTEIKSDNLEDIRYAIR